MTKYIKFTVGGYFDGYKTVEIFIGTKNVSCKILRNGLSEVDKKNSRTVEVSDEWLEEFDALNISAWEKNYSDAEILDGTQWELVFKYGKKIFRSSGSNAYPENWERFLDWLDELIPEMHFVNRKRLEKVTLNYSRESQVEETVFETLMLNRRDKVLILDKKSRYAFDRHIYSLVYFEEQIFDAAQDFFDNLEVDETAFKCSAQVKIELVRHDGSIENIDAPYIEVCLPGLTKFMEAVREVVRDLSAEIFVMGNVKPDINREKYILCKVQFKGSYKSYTYRADDETLAVGDIVDVPVGKNNDVAQAKIVEIGYFNEEEAPFPVEKIKTIIGKHVANEWENY